MTRIEQWAIDNNLIPDLSSVSEKITGVHEEMVRHSFLLGIVVLDT